MANKIIKIAEKTWQVTCENGETFTCGEWFEAKTNKWHVKLPADNPTGRTYIRVDKIPSNGLEFETKTEHREGMGWRERLTEAEKIEMAKLEKRIAELKEAAMARVVSKEEQILSKMSIEELMALIAKRKAAEQE